MSLYNNKIFLFFYIVVISFMLMCDFGFLFFLNKSFLKESFGIMESLFD